MGFFGDILRDAQRPVPGSRWLRRSTAAADEGPMEIDDAAEDEPSDGLQTVFRFQKAESPAMPGGFREASYRSGAGSQRLPAGDPSTAGTDAEGPMSTANGVGVTDMTVQGDRRGSSLETGQEERRSPDEIEAVQAEFGSSELQSREASVRLVPEQYRHEQKSTNEYGSERPDSRSEQTFLRGVTGRGAPSETHQSMPGGALAPPAPHTRGRPAAALPAVAVPSSDGRVAEGAVATPGPVVTVARPPAQSTDLGPVSAARSDPRRTTQPPRRALAGSDPARVASAWESPRHSGDGPPSLTIGRIEVVVVAAAPAAPAAPAARGDAGFLSRNYLRRL